MDKLAGADHAAPPVTLARPREAGEQMLQQQQPVAQMEPRQDGAMSQHYRSAETHHPPGCCHSVRTHELLHVQLRRIGSKTTYRVQDDTNAGTSAADYDSKTCFFNIDVCIGPVWGPTTSKFLWKM